MTDIIVTMPDTEKEGTDKLIEFYKKDKGFIYFRVSSLPKDARNGDRCFIVSNGLIIGSHQIVGMKYVDELEASGLSDGNWSAGNYIIRDASSFVESASANQPMKGFQGFRYFKHCLNCVKEGCALSGCGNKAGINENDGRCWEGIKC